MNGWLNIYKPKNISSFGVIAQIRKLFPKIKCGHAGTLDPLAEGVLPIALGEATKAIQYIMDARKIYEFNIQFGSQTSTGDQEGESIAHIEYIPQSYEECQSIIPQFIGIITQIPPKYSALKINGQRAYDLARKNIEFEIQPRQIEIFNLRCKSYENGIATYIAECSKGTYIRTLAEDISKSLQSLGFVIELKRLQVGIFSSDYAISNLTKETIYSNLIKIEAALGDIPELIIDSYKAHDVRCGKIIIIDYQDVDLAYLTDAQKLIAIGSIKNNQFKSSRVFNL